MKTVSSPVLFITIATICLFSVGCPERRSITDIEANPARYQNKEVVVAGVVKDSYGLSIPGSSLGGGAYLIDDGTGSIWIFVADGNVPSKGARIGVEGTLGSGVSWKGKNYGLGIYEEKRKYAKR